MKYSFRKSFNSRHRREIPDVDDHVYPRIDANGCSNSNTNLVKPVKSKYFLQRQHRSSPSPPPPTTDQIKSTVFEPRYPHSEDEDDNDDPFSSSINTRTRPLDRLTHQIRKSFRNTLTRQRSRLESTNSNNRLLSNKKDPNQSFVPILPSTISTGLTSPFPISIEHDPIKTSVKQRKAPLPPTQINQSISLPTEINPEQSQQNFHRSFRTRFSFLRKKRPITPPDQNITHENPLQKPTLSERFNSLRCSLHLGSRNSSSKGKRYLLSNE